MSVLHRYEDPAASSDPKIRELVGALATLEVAPPVRTVFRAELRAQLVAITPRIVAEATAEAKTAAEAPKQVAPARSGRRIRLGRPLAIGATFITVLALIFGGAVWLSQKSLPGDTLYGLKRASERFELSLDGNDTDRARDHLRFAARRVDEAKALLGRTSASGGGIQAAGVSAETVELITKNLTSSTGDVTTAWTLLSNQAQRTNSGRDLNTMTTWAPGQLVRLDNLAKAAPSGSVASAVKQARAAVAYALEVSTQTARDYANRTPGGSGTTVPGTSTKPNQPGGGAKTTTKRGGSGKTGTVIVPPGGVTTTTPPVTGGAKPSLPIQLPTKLPTGLLPTSLPKSPIKANASCVSVSIIIGVGIGNCSTK